MKQLVAALLTVAMITASPMPIFSAKGKVSRKILVKKSASKPIQETGRLIVKYKKSSKLSSIKGLYQTKKAIKGKALDIKVKSGESTAEVIDKLKDDPNVEYVEPNYIRKFSATPNDYYYSLQWGLAKIKAPGGWNYETGSSNPVTIAVIDTGVDLSHPDLSNKIVQGKDIVNNDSVAQDDHGHGTHVAGIAAASTNNGTGVAGVSWQAKIMPIKVLDSDGSGYDSWVAQGIREAVDRGADIINLSLGGAGYSATLKSATDYAYANNVLVVAAAGNSGDSTMLYPAGNPNVMGVGATNSSDKRASFSTYNSSVDISAPGEMIASTYWYYGSHVYAYLSGTSMATPHVAGLAALVKSKWPAYGTSQIASRIQGFSDDLGPYGRDNYFGYGRINLHNTLNSSASIISTSVRSVLRSRQKGILRGRIQPSSGARQVKLYQKPAGHRWYYYKSTTTPSDGSFMFGVRPVINTVYKVVAPASGSLPQVSKSFTVKAKPTIRLGVKQVRWPRKVGGTGVIKVWGATNKYQRPYSLRVRMVVGRRWRTVKLVRVKRNGRFSTYIRARKGIRRVRILVVRNPRFTTTRSTTKRVRIR